MANSTQDRLKDPDSYPCPMCGDELTPYGCRRCDDLGPEPTEATFGHAFPVGDKVVMFYRWTCGDCGDEHLTTLGVTRCSNCNINVLLEEWTREK